MNFNRLVSEWAWRVNDGMPDPKNRTHVQFLRDVLRESGYAESFIQEYTQNLTEAEKFKAKSKESGDIVVYKSKENMEKAIEDGRAEPLDSKDEKETEEKPEKDPAKLSAADGDFERNADKDDKEFETPFKDKSIQKAPEEQYNKAFKSEADISDEDYSNKTKDYKGKDISVSIPPKPFELPESIKALAESGKFPKKYAKVLERMMNTKLARDASSGGFEPAWNHFSNEPGGAGRVTSQAGELMAMVSSAMNDEEWEEFKAAMTDHLAKIKEEHGPFKTKKEWNKYSKDLIIQEDWIDAADKNRTVIQNQVKKLFPEGTEIVNTSWDTSKEVEAMGMDYDTKAFSTDMFVKVRYPDGSEFMHEVSLKKNKDVNFLNSGAGSFKDWKDDLPDNVNQSVYSAKQRERLETVVETIGLDKLKAAIEADTPAAAEARKIIKQKGIDIDSAADVSNKDKKKIILFSLKALADSGDKDAKKLFDEHIAANRQFQEDALNAIATDPDLKAGMIDAIKENFPLKSVANGDETMAIGDMSLDVKTLEHMFGTTDFDKIKDRLVSKTDEKTGKTYLAYQAELGADIIPIANVVIRESGVGYNGSFRFDMELHPEFAKQLDIATKEVYK